MSRSVMAAANRTLPRLRRRKQHPSPNLLDSATQVAAAKKRKMFFSMAEPHRTEPNQTMTAAVVTISDSCSRGEREDKSGPAVAQFLEKLAFSVTTREVVPDDTTHIEDVLMRLSERVQLIVTTGGTGIAPRDVTPEATRRICDRLVEGVAERMRAEGIKKTPL